MSDELTVPPLAELRRRRSAKWRTYPDDVLPLTVAEMDFGLAPPVQAALRAAVDASDSGYSAAVPGLGDAYAGFAGPRWGWDVDPRAVTAITDVGVGVVELLRVLTRPGDSVVISPPAYPPFFDWEPGLRFGAAGAGHVRLNFGTGPEILEEATGRMAAAVAG